MLIRWRVFVTREVFFYSFEGGYIAAVSNSKIAGLITPKIAFKLRAWKAVENS